MRYLVIEITNREPLKIGAGGSKANQTEPGKDYIPGSTLRGAIINQLIRQKKFEQNKENVLLKMYCYNAYPCRNDKLYLPAPRHLRVDKHAWREKKGAHDREQGSGQVELTDLLAPGKNKARDALEYRFLALTDNDMTGANYLIGLNVRKEYRLHHSSSKNPDQKEKENLFRYQAMAAGQTFRALIRFDPELQSLLEEVFVKDKETLVYLGGSKGSGYGLCRWRPICGVLPDYRAAKKHLGLPAEICRAFNGQDGPELRITCLSDLLLRDPYGQPVNYIPENYIKEMCGYAVELAGQCVQPGITEGYNAKWQARYPKETTLKAGSVLRYTFSENLSLNSGEWQRIAEKLENGLLGGRNQDGFGWIGVNLPYPRTLLVGERRQEQEKGAAEEAEQLFAKLRQDADAWPVLAVLTDGLEGAKDRWLKSICLHSREGEEPQEPRAHNFIISKELKKSHYRQMRNLLEEPLKKLQNHAAPAAAAPEKPARYYRDDNRLCSIATYNFTQILDYLNAEDSRPGDEKLAAYARKMLDTRQGSIFYADAEQPEKQFIAELLAVGLTICAQERREDT